MFHCLYIIIFFINTFTDGYLALWAMLDSSQSLHSMMEMAMRKGFSGDWGAASTNKVLVVQARGSASRWTALMWNLGLQHVCTSVLGKQGRCVCSLAVRSVKPKAPRVTYRLGLNKNKTTVVSDAGRHPKTLLVTRYASARHANPQHVTPPQLKMLRNSNQET